MKCVDILEKDSDVVGEKMTNYFNLWDLETQLFMVSLKKIL